MKETKTISDFIRNVHRSVHSNRNKSSSGPEKENSKGLQKSCALARFFFNGAHLTVKLFYNKFHEKPEMDMKNV